MKSLSILSTPEVRDTVLAFLCLFVNSLISFGVHNISRLDEFGNLYAQIGLLIVLNFIILLNIYCFYKVIKMPSKN